MPGQLPDPAPTFAPHAGPDFLLTWNIRGARPKAGVSLFTNGAWQVPDTSLPAGPEVSGAIVSLSDQTPPRSLLVTVRKSVDLSFRASPSSAWSTVALGTGASAAAVFDSWDRPVVVWSAAAGADGVFAVVP
jgi:hypothetical protein